MYKVIFNLESCPVAQNLIAGMAEWLGGSTLHLRVVGSSHSPDLLQKVHAEHLPMSVIPGKNAQ